MSTAVASVCTPVVVSLPNQKTLAIQVPNGRNPVWSEARGDTQRSGEEGERERKRQRTSSARDWGWVARGWPLVAHERSA